MTIPCNFLEKMQKFSEKSCLGLPNHLEYEQMTNLDQMTLMKMLNRGKDLRVSSQEPTDGWLHLQ